MRRLIFALLGVLGVATPVAAQDRGLSTLVIMRPFLSVFSERNWPAVQRAIVKADGLWNGPFQAEGFDLDPELIQVGVVDVVAGGNEELLVSYASGCGNSGCWTYIFEVRDGAFELVATTVLPEVFRVWRNPGDAHSVLQGYRHGLFWDGRAWRQFCTDTAYCG